MNHVFKQKALKDLIQYNRELLITCIGFGFTSLFLSLKIMMTHEKWVLVPAVSPERRMAVSSKGYSQTYLKEWAFYVMQALMTTSHDTVETQIEELKVLSSTNEALEEVFKKHVDFVKGSTIESVFFPKKITFEEGPVVVFGHFRYWLGSSEKGISQEKSYRLAYKRGPNDILLLKGLKALTP